MTRDHIRVVYDGPAVAEGEMEVSQLASSLLALGKLIENADAIVSGETGRVKVRVQADVQRGSFDVGIVVSSAAGVVGAAKAWLLSPDGVVTVSTLGLLGLNVKDGTKGVIQAVRWLKGRRIKGRTVLQDGNTQIELEDGDQTTVSFDVARLIDAPDIRQPLERFTEPLREEGLEEIRFEETKGVPLDRISTSEATVFVANAGSDPTSVSRFQATYQIKRLYFERGRKWRLSNGSQAIMATIEDQDFWRRIETAAESFSSADYLVCDVRMDQWFSPAGLKTEYTIEKVADHIPAPKQIGMDFREAS